MYWNLAMELVEENCSGTVSGRVVFQDQELFESE